jgi:DNA-binding NarL/FixJ family response regulator
MVSALPVCHDSTRVTVLIVDDHPSFRANARALLEADGFTVVGEAADGASALDAAAELSPEIVLLDVQLPDIASLGRD